MSTVVIAFLVVYVLLNIMALAQFGWDKRKAVKGTWRTSEAALLGFAALGPWGAIAGMRAFHHKTRKNKFALVYLFALIHLILLYWLFSTYGF